jgi:hypothetical protein
MPASICAGEGTVVPVTAKQQPPTPVPSSPAAPPQPTCTSPAAPTAVAVTPNPAILPTPAPAHRFSVIYAALRTGALTGADLAVTGLAPLT